MRLTSTLIASLSVTVALASFAQSARAGTLKVPEQYASINDAIGDAGPFDVIKVSAGTYAGGLIIGFKTDLTIIGKGKVIIDATGFPFAVDALGAHGLVLKGLRLRNSSVHGVTLTTSNDVRVEDCRIENCAGDGVHVSASPGAQIVGCRVRLSGALGVSLDSDNCLVKECRIEDNSGTGVRDAGSTNTIAENRLERNSYGVSLTNTSFGALVVDNDIRENTADGIYDSGTHNAVILGNRILDNVGDGIDVGSGSVNGVLAENRIVKAGDNAIEFSGDEYLISGNRIKKSGGDGFDLRVGAFNNLVTGNKVKKSAEYGMSVAGGLNSFTYNKATKSGDANLNDTDGTNTYADNVFPGS